MDDFGILARDFGFRPPGKIRSHVRLKGPRHHHIHQRWDRIRRWLQIDFLGDDEIHVEFDPLRRIRSQRRRRALRTLFPQPEPPEYGGLSGYDDVFGGPPRYSNQGRAPPPPAPTPSSAASPFDSLFLGSKESPTRASSMPVYDKLVYDDDIFDGVPGMNSTVAVRFDDVFASMSNAQNDASQYDDLLGNFGRAEPELKKGSRGNRSRGAGREVTGFDDLIPGFGGSSPPPNSNGMHVRVNGQLKEFQGKKQAVAFSVRFFVSISIHPEVGREIWLSW